MFLLLAVLFGRQVDDQEVEARQENETERRMVEENVVDLIDNESSGDDDESQICP